MSQHASFDIHTNGSTHTPSEGGAAKNGWKKHLSTKWWIIITLTIVILLVIALILSFTTFRQTQEIQSFWDQIDSASTSPDSRNKLTLEDILRGRFTGNGFNGTWVSDDQLFYQDEFGDPLLLNVSSNEEPKRLITKPGLIPDSAIKYDLSSDLKYLLVTYSYQKLWRHSYLANFLIIDLESQSAEPLIAPVSPSVTQHAPPNLLQLAIWSPKGNALAFVYLNEIYYRSSAEPRQQSVRVSPEGKAGIIFHGVTDWVYEEEVFSSQKSLWFSPDGLYLAFASFDDSNVGVVNLPYYGPPGALQFQYPASVIVRYPKVGTTNPQTSLSVINLHLLKTTQILPTNKTFSILNSVIWSTSDTLISSWSNRVQNEGELLACKVNASQNNSSLPCNIILNLSQPNGWLEPSQSPLSSPDGKKMAIILPHMQSERQGTYRHLTIISNISGEVVGQEVKTAPLPMTVLTRGRRTVTNLLRWDQKTNYIYFEMTDIGMPWRKRIYRISGTNINNTSPEMECISCKLTLIMDDSKDNDPDDKNSNSTCTQASIQFSLNLTYSAIQCEGPQVPFVHIYENDKFSKILNWTDNNELAKEIKNYALPNLFRVTIPLKDGYEAHAQLLLPPQLNPVVTPLHRYPLLVHVYGGPDSYQNSDAWEMGWSKYLASNLSIIVAAIDGRGSGLRSTETLFSVNRKLGTVEVQDQIDATQWLQENYKWIDKKRTAIWGWSYGGYAATLALMNNSTKTVFKCAAAVAPVSDWVNYDSIYTERYMGLPTPKDNLNGYIQASLLTKAESLRGKPYLLIHGTLDDNVHFQQSMLLSRALEKRDILFRQQTYPDETHALSGIHPHLYHTIEHFLKEDCFDLED